MKWRYFYFFCYAVGHVAQTASALRPTCQENRVQPWVCRISAARICATLCMAPPKHTHPPINPPTQQLPPTNLLTQLASMQGGFLAQARRMRCAILYLNCFIDPNLMMMPTHSVFLYVCVSVGFWWILYVYLVRCRKICRRLHSNIIAYYITCTTYIQSQSAN